jgi:predicted membrane protein
MITLFLFGGLEILFFLFSIVFAILLPVLAIVDIIKSDRETNEKLLWAVIVLLSNFLGSLLYFAVGRKQRVRP